MKKYNLYLSIIIFIIFGIFYVTKWFSFDNSVTDEKLIFNIPKPPEIVLNFKKSNIVTKSNVWGLEENQDLENVNTKESASKIKNENNRYVYKKVNGIPSIVRFRNKTYRWEFYGTIQDGDEMFGVFYNPFLKMSKSVKKGEKLDEYLVVRGVFNDKVTVKCGTKKFVLEIFNFSKENKK